MCNIAKSKKNYELVAPEGGWGYMIALAVIIVLLIAVFQSQMFGIVYGPFLASVGNEATDTSTVSSISYSASLLTGLLANVLLQKLSYRKVAVLGSLIYVFGAFATIFVTSTFQLTMTYGIIKGIGWSLTFTSILTTFNDYFVARRSFVMNSLHTVLSIIVTSTPIVAKFCMDTYGFRGTAVLLAGNSLHLIFAALCLHPVKWHMKKRCLSTVEMRHIHEQIKSTTLVEETTLLENKKIKKLNTCTGSSNDINVRARFSKQCCAVYNTLDLGLFKDPVYVNLAVGLSLTIAAEIQFSSFAPLLLNNAGFNQNEVTTLMTIHLICDLVGKILLSIVTAFVDVKNRHLQLFGMLIMAALCPGFAGKNSFAWTAIIYAVLGLGRGLVQNTMSLVFAENYPKRYVTSYTLFMFVNAIVSFTFGQIIGVIMITNQNKNVILYAVAIAPGCSAITWTIELIFHAVKQRML